MNYNSTDISIPTENERIMNLSEYDLDYQTLETHLGDLTELAANISDTKVSLINLIDNYSQWSVAGYGMEIGQMDREDSICNYTIKQNDPLEIQDLKVDERFNKKSYVEGESGLRYYFGIPLKTDRGNAIGSLCVLDKSHKKLSPSKVKQLQLVADEIMNRLNLLKKIKSLQSVILKKEEIHRKLCHDIRGPLGGIMGLSEMIREQGDDNTIEDVLDSITLIHQSSQTLLEMANELLSEADFQNANDEFRITLPELGEKIEKLYSPMASSKGVHFTVEVDGENNNLLFSNRKLYQIIGNLVSNSVKFTPKGGQIKTSLRLEEGDVYNRLFITVKDTGIGISDQQIQQILNGNAITTFGTEGEAGFGLGLANVKKLVEEFNGSFKIESNEGEGTTFKLSLQRIR